MVKLFHKFQVVLEILLFIISIFLLTYFSENQSWTYYFVTAIITVGLFIFLAISKLNPITKLINKKEQEQFSLLNKINSVGIKDIFNMKNISDLNHRNYIIEDMIKNGNLFNLLGLTGTSYLDPSVRRHWDTLKLKLEEGAQFNLIILNPFSKEKEIRNRLNGISATFDSKLKLDRIVELYNKFENFDVKISNVGIYCSVFFSENKMIYDPYHLGKLEDRIENYFFALEIEKKQDSYYFILKKHFEFLWQSADTLETFFHKNPDIIKNLYGKELTLKRRYQVGE